MVANAALAGQTQIMNQMRRSYSTGDVNQGENVNGYTGPAIEEILEEEEEEGTI